MSKFPFFAAAILAAFPQISSAAEVTGGTVGVSYSQFTGDNVTDLNKTSLTGSLNVGFTRQFSMQGDVSFNHFDAADSNVNNVALHGIYHANASTVFGAYYGQNTGSGDRLDYYGLEAGHDFGQFGAEAYVSHASEDGVSGSLYGVSGRYAVNDALGVNVAFDKLSVEGLDAHRAQIGVDYTVSNAVTLSGDIGQAKVESTGSQTYVAIGAKLNFGKHKGATFQQRDLTRIVPGS
jgi:hypothetical protein